jgi:DNA-directed RNA polymerase subunit RPC12/RpoP
MKDNIQEIINELKMFENIMTSFFRKKYVGLLETLEEELSKEEPPENKDSECHWKYLDSVDEEYYETGCGKEFVMLGDCTIEESDFKFCVYCGGKIIIKAMKGE